MSGKLFKNLNSEVISNTNLLQTILESMSVGVFLVNLQGTIIYWNAIAEKITGYSREEMIGKQCGNLPGEVCREGPCRNGILGCGLFTAREHVERECRIVNKQGDQVYILKSARVIYDKKNKPLIGIVNLIDVTKIHNTTLEISYLKSRVKPETRLENLVGATPVMHKIFSEIRLASQSDASILISGESGTGKELAAMAIHQLSPRKDKPMITVNCCSLPESLLESELFGHIKGSFTGAIRDQKGRFEAADGGTIFIDEIGELPLVTQVKLLRFLQTHTIERIGETIPRKLDVRVISATNHDLMALVKEGRFREDLYYRINVFPITMPSLRERKDDILLLVNHFLEKFSKRTGKKILKIQDGVLEKLRRYHWPGNIRELENAIEHAFVKVQGNVLTVDDLPESVISPEPESVTRRKPGKPLKLTREIILQKLEENDWRREQTANSLGISRITLWKRMKEFGLQSN